MTATSDPNRILVVLCAVPADFDAEGMATRLVEGALAACVQVGTSIRSVYRWRGELERADERLLLIKTTKERYPELETAIRATHPYEVPEIVALEVADANAGYVTWVMEETGVRPAAPGD